jgi:glycosyltransferase involved in cell wall biosynthesis
MNLYGGALQVYYLLRGLQGNEDIENILVCPDGSRIGEEAAGIADKVFPIPMRGDLDAAFIFRLKGIIRTEKPDIVHLHSRRGADLLGGIAARLSGTRCILTRRVDNPEPAPWARLKYRLYDRIVTISHGIRDVLVKEGVPDEKVTVVHSAVDVEKYSQPCDRQWFLNEFGLPENTKACGVIAQFIERKGHRFLLEAIPGILESCPEARFLFFGKGPLEKELKQLCEKSPLSGHVIFAGFRDDLDRILPCLELVVHPALMEGLGVSLLQAAAAGVPIVATSVGGIPEVLKDGESGFLVRSGNSECLIEPLINLLQDPSQKKRMGHCSQERIKSRFSIQSMVDGYIKIYSQKLF